MDLATKEWSRISVPTLLIVGSRDEEVLEFNQRAQLNLRGAQLKVVLGASHLFEERGKLKEVADLATQWFIQHFTESEEEQAAAS